MSTSRPFIVGVGGFSSNVGKTTLMCELLRNLPGWEAIKTTRGHYRSCGKDPVTCCVSHLLGDQPTIRSGRRETFAEGKDTGRYWEAGAANVHWVIATEEQVGPGIQEALARVKSRGVIIEGNSFAEYVDVDFMLMVCGGEGQSIKRSARTALKHCSGVYQSSRNTPDPKDVSLSLESCLSELPVFTSSDLSKLVNAISSLSS